MKNLRLNKTLKGYSLIELLAVLAIISIMSTITLAASLRYNKIVSILLNDVNSITMLVREMQNRTSSFVAADAGVSNIGHGVFVDIKTNKNKIETFYKTSPGVFTVSETLSPKPSENLLLDSGNYISRICVNGCSTYWSAEKVAVYFLKPKSYMEFSIPDPANLSTYINNVPGRAEKINKVCLEVSSATGNYKKRIDMYYVGQISFASGPCQ